MNTWKGRNLWGMMVRDDHGLRLPLATRPEVDANRIGSIGLSLGCFRTFYVAALDNRVKVAVPVSCITRNADLIKNEGLGRHGIYYYVYDLISHFDTESIMACIAPRACSIFQEPRMYWNQSKVSDTSTNIWIKSMRQLRHPANFGRSSTMG
ncbi:MAG: hypothetical protein IPF93_10920 [Saprospiraceae bacterium]|nr:hypothetical protein [Saprospiraceae bacterium]